MYAERAVFKDGTFFQGILGLFLCIYDRHQLHEICLWLQAQISCMFQGGFHPLISKLLLRCYPSGLPENLKQAIKISLIISLITVKFVFFFLIKGKKC